MERWKLLIIYMGIQLILYIPFKYDILSIGEALIIYLICFQITNGVINEKKEKELNK